MTTQVEEPPLLRRNAGGGGGGAAQWANLALMLAEALRMRRERAARTAYSDASQADREFLANLERAQQPIPARPAHATEREAHRTGGLQWHVGGRGAGETGAAVTTEISQVGGRWLLHAVGHQPTGVPDTDAFVSCSSWQVASHLATSLINHNDPERVERLRDNAEFASRSRATRQRGYGHERGYDDPAYRHNPNHEEAEESAQNPTDPGPEKRSPEYREANKAAMREELEAVWPKATVEAVVNGRAWPHMATVMDDAQRDGHDLVALLKRMDYAALTRPHVYHPAALASKMLKNEVAAAEKARTGEHIVIDDATFVPSRPSEQAGETLDEDPTLREDRDQAAAAGWAADDHPVDEELVRSWVEGLDGDSYIDRVAADEVRGQFGATIDQALAEKFPGILNGPAEAPTVVDAAPNLGGRDGARVGRDQAEAAQWAGQSTAWRARGDDDTVHAAVDEEQAEALDEQPGHELDTAEGHEHAQVDAHDAAAEYAHSAEGLEHAATARAQVSATPTAAARSQAAAKQGPAASTSKSAAGRVPGPRRTPAAPGQRPGRSR